MELNLLRYALVEFDIPSCCCENYKQRKICFDQFITSAVWQVEGLCKQSMATQGDAACCYISVEDACEYGCAAACERASHNANSSNAYQVCEYKPTSTVIYINVYTAYIVLQFNVFKSVSLSF